MAGDVGDVGSGIAGSSSTDPCDDADLRELRRRETKKPRPRDVRGDCGCWSGRGCTEGSFAPAKVPLYGEADAGRIWNRTAVHQLVHVQGFQQSEFDPCYFFKQVGDERVDIALYVDDGYVLG